jgi:purine catabolism regulator
VLALPALEGASVLAGSGGLDRTVRSVNVMEVPDILDWVRADELLLTTAYPLRDRPEALARLVPELHALHLAGIAVKPARYIERVPDAMLRDADRLGFPVLALPPGASFNQILNGVLTVLLNRQAARLQRAAEIHQRFNDLVLTGGGLSSIATALAQALARPVALVDASGVLRAATEGFAPDASAVASFLATGRAGTGDSGPWHFELDGQSLLVQPVRAGDELHGAVVTVQSDEGLTDDAREALQYAATVSALRQVQARAVAEEERRLHLGAYRRRSPPPSRGRAAGGPGGRGSATERPRHPGAAPSPLPVRVRPLPFGRSSAAAGRPQPRCACWLHEPGWQPQEARSRP